MKHRRVAALLAALSASALVFVFAPTAPAQDQDVCADFNSQEDAQAVLDADPGLAQRQPLFDVDMDGIACEDLPSRGAPAAPTRGVPRLTG